jgi:transforming growth factor-beta-induced protein
MFKASNLWSLLLLTAFALGFAACNNDDDEQPMTPTTEQTIVEVAAGDAQFSTLVSALERVGLVATLEGPGPFTVFAPTNAAFAALGIDLATVSDQALTEILLYHVFGGEVKAGDLQEGQTYATTAATTGPGNTQLSLLVEKTGSMVRVNNAASVTSADIITKNGVIHVIDAVLLPLDVVGHAAANSNFSQLVGALSAAPGDLVSVLQGTGPFTVFAPLNSAFEAISGTIATLTPEQIANVLTYHVVGGANVRSSALTNGQVVTTVNGDTFVVNISGSNVSITDKTGNNVSVVLADVQGTNGVIHVITEVLIPDNL